MCTLDNLFGTLPFFISLYLLKNLLVSLVYCRNDLQTNYLCLRNMFFLSLISSILKYILKKKRRSKTVRITSHRKTYLCCNFRSTFSKFGFPSNHTVFFVSFYLDHPNIFILLLAVLGMWSRVYFEHHTIIEVSESIVISIAFRDILQSLLSRTFRIEMIILNMLVEISKLLIEHK